MRQRILKIAISSAIGFVIPLVFLSTVTGFVLLPSLTVCGLVFLSAVASYIPRNGAPIAVSLLTIGVVFAVSIFMISSAFGAVPQPRGPILIPLGSTAAAFALLMLYGNRRRPAAECTGSS